MSMVFWADNRREMEYNEWRNSLGGRQDAEDIDCRGR